MICSHIDHFEKDDDRDSLKDSEPINKSVVPQATDNPFLINENDQSSNADLNIAANESTVGENPFLNFDQGAVELDDEDKLDPNNNLNVLSDKLDSGLTVKDTSPFPNCPPSSPFDIQQDSTNPDSIEKAIDKLSSEN